MRSCVIILQFTLKFKCIILRQDVSTINIKEREKRKEIIHNMFGQFIRRFYY